MIEVLWVTVFGAGLAWLQARSQTGAPPVGAEAVVDEGWSRWEEEIHDWREQ